MGLCLILLCVLFDLTEHTPKNPNLDPFLSVNNWFLMISQKQKQARQVLGIPDTQRMWLKAVFAAHLSRPAV